MGLFFEIENAETLQNLFAKAPQITEKWMQKALNAAVQEMQKHNIKGVTPWDTGSLSQTFQWQVNADGARFFPTRYYAPFVYYGTKHQKPQKYLDAILDLAKEDITRHFGDAAIGAAKEIAA